MFRTITDRKKKRLCHRWIFIVPLIVLSGNANATEVIINGIEGELADNVQLSIGQAPPAEEKRKLERYTGELNGLVANALAALGYYNAEIDVSTRAKAADQPAAIILDIDANEPVRIKSFNITIDGSASEDPQFRSARSKPALKEGSIFVSADYEASKASLIRTAQDLGYFDFEFSKTEVRVSRRQLAADVTIHALSGERYKFGPVQFDKTIFTETFLRRWLTFDSGDPYDSSLLGELTQNLQSSGYFSGVRVKPVIDPRYSQIVPVAITLTRKKKNEVAIGIGYATDTKLRTKLTWGKPLINSRGHSAEYSLGLSRDTQSAGFSYRIPRKTQPLFNYWSIDYQLKNDVSVDTESFLSTLNLQRVTRTEKLWTESLFLRWERETFTTGSIEDQTDLLLPGISYSRSRSKGSPFPTWGQAFTFQLLGGSKRIGSSIDLFKTVGTYRHLRAISPRNTLIGTFQFGALKSNDYDRVPVSQRFFAGGDRSIRGFAYRQISPTNAAGEAVGGRFLEVISAEYNYRFLDRWSFAIFSDAGRAFNDKDTRYSVGAGIGIRWQSPVGPFRIDVARPISDEESGFRVHLSLGPDL